MRLIKTTTLQLEEFFPGNIPRYAILSHTWGKEEVTFHEMRFSARADVIQKSGFKKIAQCCEQSLRIGIEYAWVDTCCTIQAHHRRQCTTKRAASAAENDGSRHQAFEYQASLPVVLFTCLVIFFS